MTTPQQLFEGGRRAAPALTRLAASGWKWLLALGIVSVLTGVLALVWPGVTILVVATFFGAYLLVSGILQLVWTFAPHLSAGTRLLSLVAGLLSIVLGVICFRDVLQSIVLLSIWIGAGWLVTGISRIVLAADTPPGTPGRGWAAAFGVIVALGGLTLITVPLNSIVTLTVVSACFLVAGGVVEIIEAFHVRKISSAL
ncbi:HdeD family acid-resistance protein [Tsukamurella sp. 8F]|uniref:HdeD family acid-resistance protein n=1 Tax=unclassified Tsukamurella TaxID=2633480 RepID=UPI0023B95CBE|nr:MULTISPECIES: HdeD family acid-resistance protein [unclassified Tsukamurella]MDF0530401.1 HdeD family acid-resistance protein [Tsukamurella sp. 8J]MDF0587778.1 HdeD family acid-resistance protein [Tsukamurella sp. 8F]